MTQKSNKSGIKVLRVAAVLLLIGGVGALGWQYYELRSENKDLKATINTQKQEIEEYKTNPEAAAQAEVQRIIEEVGRVYDLPSDETPSVATVQDKEKLSEQPFFARAENGDITLIYQKSRLALLYRPSTQKVINVSSVTIQDQAQGDSP